MLGFDSLTFCSFLALEEAFDDFAASLEAVVFFFTAFLAVFFLAAFLAAFLTVFLATTFLVFLAVFFLAFFTCFLAFFFAAINDSLCHKPLLPEKIT
ncbi:MAG: hypothetical protein D6797_02880 [Bdellovibrio sp.]|nr:MAG: hypothetical protein D6797_02880 [Bdellovibrio sp.]